MLHMALNFMFQMINYRTVLDLELKILQDGKIPISEQRTPTQILRVPAVIPRILQRLLISHVHLLTRYS